MRLGLLKPDATRGLRWPNLDLQTIPRGCAGKVCTQKKRGEKMFHGRLRNQGRKRKYPKYSLPNA